MAEQWSSAAQEQFGRQAAYYVRSQTHATGDTLQTLVEWAQPKGTERALDVGTGTGFTAFAFAPHVASAAAYDLTSQMLQEAVAIARQRGLSNVAYVQGAAERLPFPDDTFDIHTCRTAAHHFQSVADYLAEARRVLKPGGQILMVDTVTTEDAEVDRWHNHVELLRDPSHVRDYSPSEWMGFFRAAGLRVTRSNTTFWTGLTFLDWVERSGTPPDAAQELRRLFAAAMPTVARALEIIPRGDDFSFSWPVLVVQAVKP